MSNNTYKNLQELLAGEGVNSPYELGRDIYKFTACGPWVAFMLRNQESVQYTDQAANKREAEADWWHECYGIVIGSIVEGCDSVPAPISLEFPFSGEALEQAIESVDLEADEIWDCIHGEDE